MLSFTQIMGFLFEEQSTVFLFNANGLQEINHAGT